MPHPRRPTFLFLPLQAFLAGAFLVFLVHLPGLPARGRGNPPPPSQALASTRPRPLDPPALQNLGNRLWEARAWPPLWKKSPLLVQARKARDRARTLGLKSLAARMEVLLEIYGPARR